MPDVAPCRILVDPEPNSGAWNMAVDETLLESALHEGLCSVRVYEWSEATVSLGYFQQFSDYERSQYAGSVPAVRRLTGGGAILHHHELTYSCAVPSRHGIAARPSSLHDTVHSVVVRLLSDFGVQAHLRGSVLTDQNALFLCFGRGDARDVLLDGHKILGSAQRRRRQAILQHGSLLLRTSRHAAQFPGLCNLRPRLRLPADFSEVLARRIADQLAPGAGFQSLSPAEWQRARELAERRYACIGWSDRSGTKEQHCGVNYR